MLWLYPLRGFSWKYDETAPGCIMLKEVLTSQIMALADSGITDWFSGMALGTDLWCAQIVLDFQKKNPALSLHCTCPARGKRTAGVIQRGSNIILFWSRLRQLSMWDTHTILMALLTLMLLTLWGFTWWDILSVCILSWYDSDAPTRTQPWTMYKRR